MNNKKYDTNVILENAKKLAEMARQLSDGEPMTAKMSLESAASQIHREVECEATVEMFFAAMRIIDK